MIFKKLELSKNSYRIVSYINLETKETANQAVELISNKNKKLIKTDFFKKIIRQKSRIKVRFFYFYS